MFDEVRVWGRGYITRYSISGVRVVGRGEQTKIIGGIGFGARNEDKKEKRKKKGGVLGVG